MLVAHSLANDTNEAAMKPISLPVASALPPGLSGLADGLPLDLAMLDGGVSEEAFAALLAGQLQAAVGFVQQASEAAGESAETLMLQAAETDAPVLTTDQLAALGLPGLALGQIKQASQAQSGEEPELGREDRPLPLGLDDDRPAPAALPFAPPGQSVAAAVRQDVADRPAAFATPAAINAADRSAIARALAARETSAQSPVPAGVSTRAPELQQAAPELVSQQPEVGDAFVLPQGPTPPPPAIASAPANAVVQTAIPQLVGSQSWGGMVGERVVWMVGHQHQSAEIMINPPALGPLEVKLSMSDGQANLTFTTQHAPVREALEAAAPRLREMLSESGIGLGSVSVNVGNFARQDAQQQQQPDARPAPAWAETRSDSGEFKTATTLLKQRSGSGLLDLFA